MAQPGSLGRSILIGATLGLLAVIAAVVAFVMWGGDELPFLGEPEPIERLLVACESRDVEGASITGVIFILAEDGSITPVDPRTRVSIPGTTYDLLQDAVAFGGGDTLARAWAETGEGVDGGDGADAGDGAGGGEPPEWLLLDEATWLAAVDEAGGVDVEITEGANVFLGDELYVFEPGGSPLTGHETHAYLAWVGSLEGPESQRTSDAVTEAVGRALLESWSELADSVDAAGARSSVSAVRLREFGDRAGLR